MASVVVSTRLVGTAVPASVVGTMAIAGVVPTRFVGTVVPTIIVLTAYYWKSCVPVVVVVGGVGCKVIFISNPTTVKIVLRLG